MTSLRFGFLALATSVATPLPASAAALLSLDLPGSQLAALSADGCVAAGGVLGGSPAGFRWTRASGAEPLQDAIAVQALSPSGAFAAGSTLDSSKREVASYWDAAGTLHRLASMPGLETIGTISQAHAIADGPRVAGSARRSDGVRIAFEWNTASGMQALVSQGHADETRAIAISGDGRRVAGWARDGDRVRALRWRDGRLLAPASEGETGPGEVLGGSRDADVLVGWLGGRDGSVAALYRETGLQQLAQSTAAVRLRASSDDGKVLVGDSGSGDERSAWVWFEQEGFVALREVLAGRGVPLAPDWRPLALTAVSADGKRLGGWGKHGDGRVDSFIVDLGSKGCDGAARRPQTATAP